MYDTQNPINYCTNNDDDDVNRKYTSEQSA